MSDPRERGKPYAVIVWKGVAKVVRREYDDPLDALCAAIEYLRKGYNVRLSNPTCAAVSQQDRDVAQMVRRVTATVELVKPLRNGTV